MFSPRGNRGKRRRMRKLRGLRELRGPRELRGLRICGVLLLSRDVSVKSQLDSPSKEKILIRYVQRRNRDENGDVKKYEI